MTPSEMRCGGCEIAIRGVFAASSLAQLPIEHQRFIELFVISSGNLKEIAALAGVSYPTVRNRLDKVIESLRAQLAQRDVSVRETTTTELPTSETPTEVPAQDASAAEIIRRIG